MAKFLYLFRGGAFVTPGLSPTEMQRHLDKWTDWITRLAEGGHHLGGAAVHRVGKCVRGKEKIVTDGPYAESKDLVTGDLLIEAASLDAATKLAQQCPIFEFDGSVEVRPVFEEAG